MAFPQTPLQVDIELYYSAAWNNINQYVYHRSANPIVITRGRQNEGQACDPGHMTLELNNRDGRFSPRNPNSPLFGLIGRNTPIRVKVTFNAITYVRFTGEVSSWPSRWDVTGRDIWVPVDAWGILRRLGQGEKPIKSAVDRTILGDTFDTVAYWPLTDGELAYPNFQPSTPDTAPAVAATWTGSGIVAFAGDAGIPGSDPVAAVVSGQNITFPVRGYAETGEWTVQNLVHLTSTNDSVTTSINIEAATGPYLVNADVTLAITPTLGVTVVGPGGTVFTDTESIDESRLRDRPVSLIITSKDLGGGNDTFVSRLLDDHGQEMKKYTRDNFHVHGRPRSIRMGGLGGVGHLRLLNDTAFDIDNDGTEVAWASSGFDGEAAGARFARVATQSSIPYVITGTSSARMSGEAQDTLLGVLRAAEDVDQGFIYEIRDSLGLTFRTNSSRYNQVPTTLSYTAGNISPPFDPEPDDFTVANDREVKRSGGSSARAELESGPLSIQDPPDGVGRYDDSITLDLFDDDQTTHVATWRLHIGTWDAERYPQVHVDLAAASNTTLIPQITSADSGSQINITNLPSWLPPETAELLIEGYTETIGFFDWSLTFNTSPAGPYQVVSNWDM
jgi:hypothetical protein